jgi:hypothetical protein
MNITTLQETQPPLDLDTIARTTFVNDPDQLLLLAGPDRDRSSGESQRRRTV